MYDHSVKLCLVLIGMSENFRCARQGLKYRVVPKFLTIMSCHVDTVSMLIL